MEWNVVRTCNVDAVRAGLLALALAACGGTAAEVRDPNGVAVIIGNRDYVNDRVPEVAFAHRDAEAFKRYVLDVLGYDADNVIDLRDASQAEMTGTFGGPGTHEGSTLWSYLDPEGGSDVVVFYSGHGAPGQRDRRGYLLPSDANPDTVEINGYPIDLLYENLGKLEEARGVRVYLDACFSGDSHQGMLIRAASPVAMSPLPPTGAEGLVVLTAASGTQLASWDEEAGHGMFTHHLLDALYGEGDGDGDGRVTAGEVKRYLDRHMTRAARRTYRRRQHAGLTGERDAVLAEASAAGAFPERPVISPVSGGREEAGKKKTEEEVVEPAVSARAVEEMLGMGYPERVAVQMGLASAGHDPGPADGVFGVRTRGALRAWQESKGLEGTGHLTKEQLAALEALGREGEKRRAEAEHERKAREEAKRERLRAVAERKRVDDEAFARAKAEGTVSAFDGYLSSCGEVCGHGAEARRSRAEAEERERFRPGKRFRDCEECPEMVVVPAGSFMMGSPGSEEGRDYDEGPVHRVTIGRAFAVGVYEVTFGEWDACVSGGGCGGHRPDDQGWGRGRRPVINVSGRDAQGYLAWLSGKTGKEYRFLSESEWEYVARAGTRTRYWWGDGIGRNRASCNICGSRYGRRTAPVGSFPANAFGLHDVHGNVREWVGDCWNDGYHGAPADGSAWESGDCSWGVLRGGSWNSILPGYLRSASREWGISGRRPYNGFRVARTLTP